MSCKPGYECDGEECVAKRKYNVSFILPVGSLSVPPQN